MSETLQEEFLYRTIRAFQDEITRLKRIHADLLAAAKIAVADEEVCSRCPELEDAISRADGAVP